MVVVQAVKDLSIRLYTQALHKEYTFTLHVCMYACMYIVCNSQRPVDDDEAYEQALHKGVCCMYVCMYV